MIGVAAEIGVSALAAKTCWPGGRRKRTSCHKFSRRHNRIKNVQKHVHRRDESADRRFISSVGLIAAMILSAVAVSKLTGISMITSVLAFSPGGIAEMAATSITLHEDSTFVVAVQVIRIVLVIAMLPPFYRLLHRLSQLKRAHGERGRAERGT